MEYSQALRLVFSIELLNLMIWLAGGRGISDTLKHKTLKQSRVDALKQEILTKIGVPPPSQILNSTVAEKRAMVRLYKESLSNSNNQELISHSLYSEEPPHSRKFYTFKDSGMYTSHEFHETCHSVTFYSMKKKTPNDAVTPQCQSQFTPKMKANAVPRLLSSLV